MKIDKFNQIFEKTTDSIYPFKCRHKYIIPDPGICDIIVINFESEFVTWSNGYIISTAGFDEIEFIPDIFVFNKYNL